MMRPMVFRVRELLHGTSHSRRSTSKPPVVAGLGRHVFNGCKVWVRSDTLGDKPTSYKGHVGVYTGERGGKDFYWEKSVTVHGYPKARLLGYRWPLQFEAARP
jgi:hypothetical protein